MEFLEYLQWDRMAGGPVFLRHPVYIAYRDNRCRLVMFSVVTERLLCLYIRMSFDFSHSQLVSCVGSQGPLAWQFDGWWSFCNKMCSWQADISSLAYLWRFLTTIVDSWKCSRAYIVVRVRSESECKCLTCNQKPIGSQFSLLHEPN